MILNWRSRKFLLKIFSLFFSLFIWFYVVSTAEIEVTKVVPINLNLPKGLAISNDVPRSLNFQLTGPGLFVRRFLNVETKVTINEKDFYQKGKRKYSISLDRFKPKLPLGVELIAMEPRYINVNLENVLKRKIKVIPSFSANLLENYQVEKIKVIPEYVYISGPKSIVRKIRKVETKLIESVLNDKGEGIRTKILTESEKIKVSQENVVVNFILKSKLVKKELNSIPIIFQSNGLIKGASHKSVQLVIEGDEKILKNVNNKTFQVLAIIDKKSEKAVDIELITELPEGIKLISINPSKVRVQMESD